MRNFAYATLVAFVSLSSMGCGMGSQVLSGIKVETKEIGSELYAEMSASLASGPLSLPPMVFPLYDPNNPSREYGQIEVNGKAIMVRLNVSQALKFPVVDGSTLPNGTSIPIALPAGLKSIGIPAFNSNSRVYVAASTSGQIMIGVAIGILKEDALKLPINLFLPFSAGDVQATAGFYMGDTQGVAVFALYQKSGAPSASIAKAAAIALPQGAALSAFSDLPMKASGGGKMSIKRESITNSKVRRLQKTWESLDRVKLD